MYTFLRLVYHMPQISYDICIIVGFDIITSFCCVKTVYEHELHS